MKKTDINQFAATLFRNYEPGQKDERFYLDRFKNYLDGFKKRKQTTPTVTDRQFKESERVIMRRLLESDDLDSSNTRFATRYRDYLIKSKDGILATNKNNQPSTPPGRLELIFDSISKFKSIMELLVKEKLVVEHTYIWKDEGKGNKSYLAAFIKALHGKGYYKDDKMPTNNQIKSICINSFGWYVGIDTIKRAKSINFDFSFIPPASSIG